jgi:hypothetical protein
MDAIACDIVRTGTLPVLPMALVTRILPECVAFASSGFPAALHGVSGEVMRLFEIGAFLELFVICPTQQDAIGKLRRP